MSLTWCKAYPEKTSPPILPGEQVQEAPAGTMKRNIKEEHQSSLATTLTTGLYLGTASHKKQVEKKTIKLNLQQKSNAHVCCQPNYMVSVHTCCLHLPSCDVFSHTLTLGQVLRLSLPLKNSALSLEYFILFFFLILSSPLSQYLQIKSVLIPLLIHPEILFCEKKWWTQKAWEGLTLTFVFLQRIISWANLSPWLPERNFCWLVGIKTCAVPNKQTSGAA